MANEKEGLEIALDALTERIRRTSSSSVGGPDVLNALRMSKTRLRESAMWLAEADALQNVEGTSTIKTYLERG